MRATISVGVGLGALVLAFWGLRVGSELVFFDAVPEAFYRRALLALSLPTHPSLLLVAVVSALPLAARAPFRWDAIEAGTALRWVTCGSVFVLAWTFSTYQFNFYYGHAHAFERLLLLALAFGVWRNAAWIPAFVVMFLVLLSQFAHPMGMKSFPTIELRIAQDLLFVMTGYVLLRSAGVFVARWRPAPLDGRLALVLVMSVTAAYYFFPATEKIRISPNGTEWVLKNDLSYLLVEASRHGWLHWLGADAFETLRAVVSTLSPLMLGTAIALELGCLLLFVSRRYAVALLAALAGFHVATVLISGYFFWKWLMVDACLAMGLWRLGADDARAVFSRRGVVLSLVLIPLAAIYADPNRLAWFERSYDYYFRFELEGEDGRNYSTDPSSFAPYTIAFAYDRFNHLLPRNALRGQKNYWVSRRLLLAGPENVERVRARYGKPFRNPEATRRLDHFLVTYFRERNRHAGPGDGFGWLRPPVFQVRWVNVDPDPYAGQAPIRRVRVRYVEEYFAGPEVVLLRDEILREVDIAGAPTLQRPASKR